MAPISAPIFIVLAMRRKMTSGITIFLEYFFLMADAKPFPVTSPILAHIS